MEADKQQVAAALAAKKIPYRENEAMKLHTSFGIGGPAAFFCEPQDEEQLAQALDIAGRHGIPYTILGLGTNVLYCDDGYPGMVLWLGAAFGGIEVRDNSIVAGAGAPLKAVCEAAQRAGLCGLEFAFGIPGSVGGAVYMNAGAFDSEMRAVLETVSFLDEEGRLVTRPVEELQLSYRTSLFQQQPWVIVKAQFALRPGDSRQIEDLMQQHMQHRIKTQPLELPSAGSAFKRPEGAFAGALIDQCGLRGYRVRDAAISEKHCGFIVNLGDASCRDVLELADHVVDTVRQQTGFELEKEIRVISG